MSLFAFIVFFFLNFYWRYITKDKQEKDQAQLLKQIQHIKSSEYTSINFLKVPETLTDCNRFRSTRVFLFMLSTQRKSSCCGPFFISLQVNYFVGLTYSAYIGSVNCSTIFSFCMFASKENFVVYFMG